jgi:hypothetical protein
LLLTLEKIHIDWKCALFWFGLIHKKRIRVESENPSSLQFWYGMSYKTGLNPKDVFYEWPLKKIKKGLCFFYVPFPFAMNAGLRDRIENGVHILYQFRLSCTEYLLWFLQEILIESKYLAPGQLNRSTSSMDFCENNFNLSSLSTSLKFFNFLIIVFPLKNLLWRINISLMTPKKPTPTP